MQLKKYNLQFVNLFEPLADRSTKEKFLVFFTNQLYCIFETRLVDSIGSLLGTWLTLKLSNITVLQ